MNACVPTNKSFCAGKKAVAKPRSNEASRRMKFYRTHDIEIITDPQAGTAKIKVSKK